MKIIKARTEHLEEMAEIWKDFMDYHKQLDPYFARHEHAHEKFVEYIGSILENDLYLVRVAIENDRIIGQVVAQVAERPPVFQRIKHCIITDIVVIEGFYGEGVGKALMNSVVGWARKKGLDRIELDVAPGNKRGYSFYQKSGFKDYLHKLFLEI